MAQEIKRDITIKVHPRFTVDQIVYTMYASHALKCNHYPFRDAVSLRDKLKRPDDYWSYTFRIMFCGDCQPCSNKADAIDFIVKDMESVCDINFNR